MHFPVKKKTLANTAKMVSYIIHHFIFVFVLYFSPITLRALRISLLL